MDKIIDYIKCKYDPLSIIVYGSYATGTNNEHSDFDALVISKSHDKCHDVSFVGGVQLDVFVYPAVYFADSVDMDEFVQIHDGLIVMDADGTGARLREQVSAWLAARPVKTAQEIRADVAWCRKMFLRTQRDDPEGRYRWHWLLTDSLEIYCSAMGQPYSGPKRSLAWMQAERPEAFELYSAALSGFDSGSLELWIMHLSALGETVE